MNEHGHKCTLALKTCAIMHSGADVDVGVLPCIKQMSLIADIQTDVLSLELLPPHEKGHPASGEHVFGLPLSLSLHLSLVYL